MNPPNETAGDDDDEDDYMSDKFLQEAASDPKNKPSLLYSHRQRFEHQKYKRKLNSLPLSKRSMKEMEEELRQTALDKPMLDSKNKGFQLLQKMMAKKQNPDDDATNPESSPTLEKLVAERKPISIEMRTGRKGLGHENKRLKIERAKKSETSEIKPEEYRRLKIERSDMLLNEKDYFQLQKICYNLDSAEQKAEPELEWYWPRAVIDEIKKKNQPIKGDGDSSNDNVDDGLENEEEEEEINFKTRVEELELHIRSKYFYCLWCGCRFDSKEDMEKNCPGNTRQDHD